jgi:hypothetical protein
LDLRFLKTFWLWLFCFWTVRSFYSLLWMQYVLYEFLNQNLLSFFSANSLRRTTSGWGIC